jgi:flagellar hook-associated protein 1 FlgK
LLPDGTFDGYYRVVISQIGVQGQEAMRQMELHDDILEQIDSRRQSTSGVSLDEELSNMITFQHAYNAAARAMTTFDEMLDKIINGMGVVGR